jgi:hypothetical protein
MDVDRGAPAIAGARIEIDADQQAVWELIVGFERWPEWQRGVRWLELDGGVTEGSVFRWKPGPTRITSTIRHVDPPSEVAWTGKTVGIAAVHVWRLQSSNGGTTVITEESWDGPLVRLLRSPMRKALQKELDSALGHLKAAAERRTATWDPLG